MVLLILHPCLPAGRPSPSSEQRGGELFAVDCGTVDCGLKVVGCGLIVVDGGPWTVDFVFLQCNLAGHDANGSSRAGV